MNNIKYMLLDGVLYAYIDDATYYIAEYEGGKWERTIPLLMITYQEPLEIPKEEALIITNGNTVDRLFEEITKEIEWNNREKTKKEMAIELFETLIAMYEKDYYLLIQSKPNFKYSIKDLDATYGGSLYEDIESYYSYYLELKDQLFENLILDKIDEDYIMEFINNNIEC
jgi:hypothetical protein